MDNMTSLERWPGDWRHRAVCDASVAEEHYRMDRTKLRAIARCVTCPVIQDCRQWALDHREDFGVWGGTTPKERRQLRLGRVEPLLAALSPPRQFGRLGRVAGEELRVGQGRVEFGHLAGDAAGFPARTANSFDRVRGEEVE